MLAMIRNNEMIRPATIPPIVPDIVPLADKIQAAKMVNTTSVTTWLTRKYWMPIFSITMMKPAAVPTPIQITVCMNAGRLSMMTHRY